MNFFKLILTILLFKSMVFSSEVLDVKIMKVESEKFLKVINKYTQELKKLDLYYATYFNMEDDLSKFGDALSPELIERSKDLIKLSQEELKSIDYSHLEKPYQIAYDLFKEDLEISLKDFDFPTEQLSVNQMNSRFRGYLDDSSPALTSFPFDSLKHYNDFLKRSDGFLAFVDRQISVLKLGIKNKVVISCELIDKVFPSYSEGLESEISKNPFYRPVLKVPESISISDQTMLKQKFAEMIKSKILPGFQKFDQFFQNEYKPHCRKSFGFSELPNGKAWYQHLIKARTNSSKTAEEIHQLGLSEVRRIKKEMIKVKDKMGGKSNFKQFIQKIVSDEKSYFKNPKELIAAYAKVKSEIADKLPKYFHVRPKMDYEILESENPVDSAAKYQQPTELKEYGRFIINTINLKANTILDVTTLSLHEAVPGHHFQLALQYELKDKITEYQRKIYGSTAFVEGWALYAEYLGKEMGMYEDPIQYLGHLSSEMLRACRLVVDTGIHSKKWSRKKAIQFMVDHLASDLKDIESEVDRYAVWPAQALAYKVGQLKIIELRKFAEKKLGSKFDIRKFHDAVLGNGTLSLTVLDKEVKNWVNAELKL